MVKVYVAGLLWDKKDRAKVEKIDKLCKELGFDTFLPHRDAGVYDGKSDPIPIFTKDRDEIDECDFMVALLDWKGVGSGTAWEIGYAHAKGKDIIGVVEDKKSVNEEFRTCVMCFNSVKLVEGFDELRRELERRK